MYKPSQGDFFMDWITQPETWIAFLTLVVLELVLGVDNVIFISILAGKLPQSEQKRARTTGIMLAVITRILLLLSLSWIIGLEESLFSVGGFGVSGRDLILFAGGLFLIAKSTQEIHQKLEGVEGESSARVRAGFWSVIAQIMLLDIVFSLDSVITAVGMVNELPIMIAAVVIAAVVMVFTSTPLGNFVERHPTIKMLALSFLLLIGFTLIVESLHQHIPKGYIYFAMGFSVFVETLNLRLRRAAPQPVSLHEPYTESVAGGLATSAIANMPVKNPGRKKTTGKKRR
jgi:predicted tellurium resistance membrane protein TerC